MEQIGAKYEPLDFIKEPTFYDKHFFMATKESSGPAYYIIDTTDTHGFAFAPKGAGKGKKYCIFERVQEGCRFKHGEAVHWGGTLREIRPQDWGFNLAKIKAVTQKPKMRTGAVNLCRKCVSSRDAFSDLFRTSGKAANNARKEGILCPVSKRSAAARKSA